MSSPLTGVKIIELAEDIAGEYCGLLLADAGADVIKVELAHGARSRRVGPTVDGGPAAMFCYLNQGKSSVFLDVANGHARSDLDEVTASADAIIWSSSSQVLAPLGFTATELSKSKYGPPVVAVSPFGLSGPWSDRASNEFTLQAWIGGPATRGRPDLPPVSCGSQTGEWCAGIVAAIGVLTGLRRRRATGIGGLIDVSQLETLAVTQDHGSVTFEAIAHRPFRKERFTNLPDIEPTSDGYVGFMVITAQQWIDFCHMIEASHLAEDETLFRFEVRNARRLELEDQIRRWTKSRTSDEIIELAGLFRIPVAPIGNGESLPSMSHMKGTGAFRANSSGQFIEPESPYIFHGHPLPTRPAAPPVGHRDREDLPNPPTRSTAPLDGDPGQKPLTGVRVLDLTQFWAGPFVGQSMAMLGADVVHIESVQRVDGMRLVSARDPSEEKWWEYGPLFHVSNVGKRGVTLDLSTDRGRELFSALLRSYDVLVENFSPRVLDNWGMTWDWFRAVNPQLSIIRMPAFGLDGPWCNHVGYAQTMEQISGLAWATGFPEGPPQVPNGPCDPIAGLHALTAALLALELRQRSGRGSLVEVPMVRTALTMTAQQVIEYSLNRNLLRRNGNRSEVNAPQGYFPCVPPAGKTEQWVAVSVENDDQWGLLADHIGSRSLIDLNLANRLGRMDEVEGVLAEWCATRSADAVVESLSKLGVPAAILNLPHEILDLPPLVSRHWWEYVNHPLTGPVPHGGFPIRFEGINTPWHSRPAPTLGQHNYEILSAEIGLTDEEIDELSAEGIIGDSPRSQHRAG